VNLHGEPQFQEELIHLRVAARHERARADRDEDSIQVTMADGGTITTGDVQRLVQDRVGRLIGLRFRSLELGPVVRWEALREDGRLVHGRLVLHSMVGGNEVVVWAELIIDDKSKVNRTAARDMALGQIEREGCARRSR
jgi:hypothetical protein